MLNEAVAYETAQAAKAGTDVWMAVLLVWSDSDRDWVRIEEAELAGAERGKQAAMEWLRERLKGRSADYWTGMLWPARWTRVELRVAGQVVLNAVLQETGDALEYLPDESPT
ncbi:hypothetical protein ACQEVF_57530 [Nonomuraea polychroma]|uniref:hypothetical protein n=1 Tax=Nonomuraea polychroma TaxID=46176 RepID=UPI003D910ED7